MTAHTAPGASGTGQRTEIPDGRPDAIPDLEFAVTGVRALPDAAVPTLAFRLAIGRTGGGRVRSVSLTTDVRIAVAHRRYERADRLVMARLFGQPEQWATSMRPLTWARISTVVPPFDVRTETDLAVPCSRDMELAVTSYFHGVRDGEIPLELLFSGTVFHDGPDGRLRTAQISWTKDAACRLPAGLWHEATGRYGGGTSWLPLSPATYGELIAHRDRHALTGWDETVADLLARADTTAGGTAWTP
ncbi:DUF6084 family protein [Streptomyces winkii]|uniref:DUF6084 family protein n=1 Tax=Streptomyces winkii TaxID=3051178 RepID=UPI0028D1C01E|nr:DUF6084 family protein [Streptomyces sp. DSM 40971]